MQCKTCHAEVNATGRDERGLTHPGKVCREIAKATAQDFLEDRGYCCWSPERGRLQDVQIRASHYPDSVKLTDGKGDWSGHYTLMPDGKLSLHTFGHGDSPGWVLFGHGRRDEIVRHFDLQF